MTAEFIVAAHALVFLNHKQAVLSSEVIAENVCTNPARVRKVLSKLKKAQLIETKSGAEGGYAFVKNPEQVTLRDVFDAVGGAVLEVKWRSGDPEMDCQVAAGMAPVMDDIFASVNTACKEALAKTTIAEIDHRLFPKEGGTTI